MTREHDIDRPRELERLLQPAIDEERIAANWQHVAQLRGRGATLRRVEPRVAERASSWFAHRSRWLALGAAAAIAAVALYVAWPARGPLTAAERAAAAERPRSAASGTTIDVAIAPGSVVDAPARRIVAFDDGSGVDLAGGARLQVLTNESDRFALLLVRGRVRFDVQPGGARRWEIETSRATVEVIGTAFTVESDDRRVVVAVERGVVVVRGERVPGRVARLVAGDRLAIDDDAQAHASTAAASKDAEMPATNAPTPNATNRNTTTPDATKPDATNPRATNPRANGKSPADRRLATTELAPSEPGARATSDSKKLAATLGDVEQRRASGDAAGAAELLEAALATTRDDPSLGLAEFTLGRLYLEELGAPDRAAAAFAKMIALGSPHALLEDAYARRIEALVRAHRTDDARAALADYDRLYPHGLRRTALHALTP
jgi:transmembrane sensor